jgi:hypothetical protein
MKPTDFTKGDIVRDKDGTLWNVEYVFDTKLVLVRRIDVFDLDGYEKVDSYQLTGKGPLT